jgi:hypothetical protein
MESNHKQSVGTRYSVLKLQTRIPRKTKIQWNSQNNCAKRKNSYHTAGGRRIITEKNV